MELAAYSELVQQEQNHWWFIARRAITRALLNRANLPANAAILDAGCGSGGNLSMLASYGAVSAFEMSEFMYARAKERSIGRVEQGKLPEQIPFANEQFDLITMFDVLEHIENDSAALSTLSARLKTGGKMLITVPAFGWLFSRHDQLHHHFRRYSRRELQTKLQNSGLEIELINYWNCLLFPVAVATRLVDFLISKVSKGQNTIGTKTPAPPINKLLAKLVSAEKFIIPRLPLPCGLSLVVVARKK